MLVFPKGPGKSIRNKAANMLTKSIIVGLLTVFGLASSGLGREVPSHFDVLGTNTVEIGDLVDGDVGLARNGHQDALNVIADAD